MKTIRWTRKKPSVTRRFGYHTQALVAGMCLTGRFTLSARNVVALRESAVVMRDGNYVMRVDTDDFVQVALAEAKP